MGIRENKLINAYYQYNYSRPFFSKFSDISVVKIDLKSMAKKLSAVRSILFFMGDK